MSQPYRLFNILRRMTLYGLVLGGTAGFLVTITIWLFPSSAYPTFYGFPIMAHHFIGLGTLFGILYGTIAGFMSGLAMMISTALLFQTLSSTRHFRWMMGSTTFMMTLATFVGRGLWNIGDNVIDPTTWTATMIMSLVITVYASQRVVTKYVHDGTVSKYKSSTKKLPL